MLTQTSTRILSLGSRIIPRSITTQTPPTHAAVHPPPIVFRYQHAYYVPRNSQGSLPVYTDVRNNGSRYMILIRNVQGDLNALARELGEALQPKSDEARRMRIQMLRSKHLVITGGRWKNDILQFLKSKGF